MAPVTGGSVSVDAEQIKALAQFFLVWSQDADALVPEAEGRKVTPGYVLNGPELKTRYGERVVEGYGKLLKNLQKSLYDISQELLDIAAAYVKAEDKGVDDLGRLSGLIGAVERIYNEQKTPTVPTPKV